MRGELTKNQEKFSQEYVLTGNASEAYRRAYPGSVKWKEGIVSQKASRMLRNGKVKARVDELQARVTETLEKKFDISTERLLLEQSRLAFFDARRMLDEKGQLLDPKNFPDDVAAAVSSIKVTRRFTDEGKAEETLELKLWNKNTALDSLFKNKGLYEVDNSQKKLDVDKITVVFRGGNGNGD